MSNSNFKRATSPHHVFELRITQPQADALDKIFEGKDEPMSGMVRKKLQNMGLICPLDSADKNPNSPTSWQLTHPGKLVTGLLKLKGTIA